MRLLRPHTVHQGRVDHELAAGLHDAALELQWVARSQSQDARRRLGVEAALLRELRGLDRRLSGLEHRGHAESQDRIDHLVGEVDALRARVDGHASALAGIELPFEDGAAGGYPPAPAEPWSLEYNEAHARFVASELDDQRLLAAFREGGPLPDTFGIGYDERVVEFPWVLGRPLSGRVLDAGSTLNHLHVLRRVRPRVDELHIVTLSPEEQSFPRLGVSYLYADLRDLPLRDGTYDRAISISTFEHIGMENLYYGSEATPATDPQGEALRAARELSRVVRSGGSVYLTVPVGGGERFAWVRSFTLDELDELVDAFAPREAELTFFRHDAAGWRRAGRDDVAGARYRDHFTSGPVGANRIVAAEAVGCVRIVVGR